jgi:hypothetical protein
MDWTSQQAGDGQFETTSDNVDSIWYDGPGGTQTLLAAIPDIGDTATLVHEATLSTNHVFGTSPLAAASLTLHSDASIVLHINAGGKLTLAEDVTLSVRGSVSMNNQSVAIVAGPGTVLTLDPTYASDDQAQYMIICDKDTTWDINGTEAKPATIQGVSGKGPPNLTYSNNQGCHGGTFDWANFKYLGYSDGSNQNRRVLSFFCGAYSSQTFNNCSFDGCGMVTFAAKGDGGTITLNSTSIKNTVSIYFSAYLEGRSSGFTGTIDDCWLEGNDEGVYVDWHEGWSLTNSYFDNLIEAEQSSQTTGFDLFQHNFVRSARSSICALYGTLQDSFWFHDLPTTNYRFLQMRGNKTGGGADCVWTGNIMETSSAAVEQESDPIQPVTQNGNAVEFSYNIFLPNPLGIAPGGFVRDDNTTSTTRCSIKFNTIVTTAQGSQGGQWETGIGWGEFVTFEPGICTEMWGNIFWTPRGKPGGFKMTRNNATTEQDFVYAENCIANWGWNLAEGSEGNGYDCTNQATPMFSVGTPDDDDASGSGDPGFKDVYLLDPRCLATYDRKRLGNDSESHWVSGTGYLPGWVRANADTSFYFGITINFRCKVSHTSAADNEPGIGANWHDYWEYQSCYRLREDRSRIADLIDWIFDGYKVSNPLMRNAGPGGITIGAAEYEASGTGGGTVIGSSIIQGGAA